MSAHDDHPTFDANRIFITLFILTAVEVGWSFIPGLSKFFLWGGLLLMAFFKGLFIFMYFMHMKFEGWIVKGLLVPTPFLILVVVFAITPDVAKNSRMDHSLTDMMDPVTGEVVIIGSTDGAGHGGGDSHEGGGDDEGH